MPPVRAPGEGTPLKPTMAQSYSDLNLTVQGLGTPVPATVRGGQAGPGSSSAGDCSVREVDHLASLASITTSDGRDSRVFMKELRVRLTRLEDMIDQSPQQTTSGDIYIHMQDVNVRLSELEGMMRTRQLRPNPPAVGDGRPDVQQAPNHQQPSIPEDTQATEVPPSSVDPPASQAGGREADARLKAREATDRVTRIIMREQKRITVANAEAILNGIRDLSDIVAELGAENSKLRGQHSV